MKNIIILGFLLAGFAAQSQTPVAPSAAVARSGRTAPVFVNQHYDAAKKYVVFKLWNASEPLTDAEKADVEKLSAQLAKKNIELVKLEWKTKEDLDAIFKKHNIEVSVSVENGIELKAPKYHYNTSARKAMFFFEEGHPIRICGGSNCEESARAFFKIIALN